jgi:hypothetical protein
LLTKIKTLFKYFILGELKTFARQCACVLSYMTSCVFVYDFMWMCVCVNTCHEPSFSTHVFYELERVLWFYASNFDPSLCLCAPKTLAWILCLITSLFFSFPFIFAPLSEIRDFSKTLAYQDQNSSNFGYDLLTMFKTSEDYFERFSNLVWLNSNFKFEFG